jgi:hypothetical protein
MKRTVLAFFVLAGLAAWPAVASGVTSSSDFTAGGGTAYVQNWGSVTFAVNAFATEEETMGGASGTVIIRGSGVSLKLDVVCMTNTGTFSFIETQDPSTGYYYDVSVIDYGTTGDHFAFSGPYGDAICNGGIAQENSYVTSGNLVVYDAEAL